MYLALSPISLRPWSMQIFNAKRRNLSVGAPVLEFLQRLERLGVNEGVKLVKALGLDDDLDHLDDLLRLAAGERQLFGDLLRSAHRLTHDQLLDALAQQRISGEKIGHILVNNCVITRAEMVAVLAFQQNQCRNAHLVNKLHLGNVLVANDVLTHAQLVEGLQWQSDHGGRLGGALATLGYLSELQARNALLLQRKLLASVLISAMEKSNINHSA